MGFKDTAIFRNACQRAFKDLDVDANGSVEYKEVVIGLLKLYDQLNLRLPGHVPAPKRADMMALCRRFDADGDGVIDQAEFFELAKVLAGTRTSWRESIAWVMASTLFLNLLALPWLAGVVSAGVKGGTGSAVVLPIAPLAAMLGMLLPWLVKPVEN